ncbi:MAG: LysR substrate-binding domain-containing protein [bacterium]|nr:LysR substrate-binding domain-containing protein [bacterium]
MNLRDLHYFHVLTETKHFGEAAKRCFVSQPTLSMQIKKLEETLGITLFERTNKQVLVTDEGASLLPLVKKILMLVDELKQVASHSLDPFSGELRLGVIPTLAPYLLPLIMPSIKDHFPDLKIWLIEEQTHQLVSKLEAGELDAALMAEPKISTFTHQLLFEEPFYFTCAKNNPLANSLAISLADLVNQHVMLLEEGHCLREQAMAICQLANATDVADFTATSLETLRLMVQSEMGVTLLPALAVITNPSNLLCYIPFDRPKPSRRISLFWRSASPKAICLLAIAELIKQIAMINGLSISPPKN